MKYIKARHYSTLLGASLVEKIDDERILKTFIRNIESCKRVYRHSSTVHFVSAMFYSEQEIYDKALEDFEHGAWCATLDPFGKDTTAMRSLELPRETIMTSYAETILANALSKGIQRKDRIQKALDFYKRRLRITDRKNNVHARLAAVYSILSDEKKATSHLADACQSPDEHTNDDMLSDAICAYFDSFPKLSDKQCEMLFGLGTRLKGDPLARSRSLLFFYLGADYSAKGDDLKTCASYTEVLNHPFRSINPLHPLLARLEIADHFIHHVRRQLSEDANMPKADADKFLTTALSVLYHRPYDRPDTMHHFHLLRERIYELLAEIHPERKNEFYRKANQEAFLRQHQISLEDLVTRPGVSDDVIVPSKLTA